MQAYEVEFTPAQLSPLHITDAVRVQALPALHLSVGDPDIPGKGVRIPLTSRLAASLNQGSLLIDRAKAYRDPKTGRIVLGVEQAEAANETRALVLLSASSGFPEGVSVVPQAGFVLLAKGEVGRAQQLLLIWPDGSGVTIEDPVRHERYELRRTGDQFDQVIRR
jgi:hypothetical protein